MAIPDEKKRKKLQEAHQKGFAAGCRGEFPNCPYPPDRKEEIVSWDQGIIDGGNFLIEVSRR